MAAQSVNASCGTALNFTLTTELMRTRTSSAPRSRNLGTAHQPGWRCCCFLHGVSRAPRPIAFAAMSGTKHKRILACAWLVEGDECFCNEKLPLVKTSGSTEAVDVQGQRSLSGPLHDVWMMGAALRKMSSQRKSSTTYITITPLNSTRPIFAVRIRAAQQ